MRYFHTIFAENILDSIYSYIIIFELEKVFSCSGGEPIAIDDILDPSQNLRGKSGTFEGAGTSRATMYSKKPYRAKISQRYPNSKLPQDSAVDNFAAPCKTQSLKDNRRKARRNGSTLFGSRRKCEKAN